MPHYEDDDLNKRRMVRSTREVIVEKADEWSDPWARKSTRRGSGGRENRGRGRERSYSSNSSYSTSNSSRSRSSSETSGSPSAARRKQQRTKEPRKPIRAKSRSASIKRRHSPPGLFFCFLHSTRTFIHTTFPPDSSPTTRHREEVGVAGADFEAQEADFSTSDTSREESNGAQQEEARQLVRIWINERKRIGFLVLVEHQRFKRKEEAREDCRGAKAVVER